MKRVLLIFLAVIGVIVIALAAIPLLFKDQIFQRLTTEINKNINARVYLDKDHFSVSAFRNFPNVTVTLGNFGVINKAPFEGDTLAHIDNLRLVLDIMTVIKGDQYKIKEFELERPRIKAIVLADGRANWDVALPDTLPQDKPQTGEPAKFNFSVEEWKVTEGLITYSDYSMPAHVVLTGFNHSGTGNFTQDVFDLSTKTTAASFYAEHDSTVYLNNKTLAADVVLNMDMPKSRYTFKENTIKINDFAFGFDGWLAMPDTTNMDMDLKFAARETTFRNLFSLIPAKFLKDYEKIKTDGNLAFDGFAKGRYNSRQMPGFGLNLKVNNGMVQYPDLPSSITGISTDLSVNFPGGESLEQLVTDIKQFHMVIGKNPVDLRATVKGLTEYDLNGEVKARLDLAEISRAVPTEGLTLRGLLGINASANGRYSAAKKLLPALQANLEMIDGYVKSKDFPAPLERINFRSRVGNATGQMKDTRIQIDQFNMVLENEPVNMTAYIEDLDNYKWDVKLKGALDLGKITKIYPIENTTVTGRMVADIATKGQMSDLDAQRWDRLPTSGTMQLTNINYQSKDLPQGMSVATASLNFSPQAINLAEFKGKLGKSDLNMTGSLGNYLAFIMKGGTLTGKLDYTGQLLDVNQLMPAETQPAPNTPQEPSAPVEVPKNINFDMTASIGRVLYDKWQLDNFKGGVQVKDGVLKLQKLNFDMLGGNFETNVTYDSRDLSAPAFATDLKINQLSFAKAFEAFNTVQKMAPVAKNIEGLFNTSFNISGKLDKTMSPVLNLLNGGGLVNITQASLKDLQLVSGLNSLAKTNLSNSVNLGGTTIKAEVKDGRVYFQPFDIKAGNTAINLGGSQGVDGSLDYVMKSVVPAGAVGAAVNEALAKVMGKQSSGSSNINLAIKVGGTYDKPKYSLLSATPDGTGGQSVKASVQQRVNEVKKEVEDKARAEAERLRREAEDRARAEQERLRKEAEDKLKAEQDRLRREAEERAKNAGQQLKDKFKLPGR